MTLRLIGMELIMLLVLAGVGAGPVALLRANDVGSRLAIAPGAGAALSVGILTAVNLFLPLDGALWWALLPLAIVSCALAAWQLRRRGELALRAVSGSQVLGVAAVTMIVLGAATLPLHNRLSYGVTGWGVFDAPGYVSCIEGFSHHTNDVPLVGGPSTSTSPAYAKSDWGPDWNIADRFCWREKWRHTGAETIPAAFSSSLGWQPWQILTPFMAVLLAIAALGAFALARGLSRSTLAATGAGLATGGPALYQIYIDGAAGLLAGIAMIAPLLAVGAAFVLRPTVPRLLVTALLTAGLQAVYPEVLLLPLAALGLAVLVRGIAAWRDGALHRGHVLTAVKYGAAFLALMLLFAPRSGLWTLDYYATSLGETATTNSLNYNVALQYLVGWLTQTREFYTFAFGTPSDLTWVLQGLILPELLIGFAVAAGVRSWRTLLPVAFIGVAAVQAYATLHQYSCPYCVQRTLLTTIPPISALVMAGLIWGLRRPSVAIKALAGVAVIALGLSGLHALRAMMQRADHAFMTAYELPYVSDAAAKLTDGTIALEGHASVPLWAWGEEPTTYEALAQTTDQRLSVPALYDDWGGFAFFEARALDHPVYTPSYGDVVTRFAGIETPRQVLYRRGPYAIARRARPFDAIIARGISAENRSRDPSGNAWIQAVGAQMGFTQGPPTFWVSAESPRRAYLRLRVETSLPVKAAESVRGAVTRPALNGVEICAPVPGRGARRILELPVTPNPSPLTFPTDPHDNAPYVDKSIRVAGVSATAEPCR
jgi:hypothetical protein